MWCTTGEITYSGAVATGGSVDDLTSSSVRLTNRSVLSEAIEQIYDPAVPCSLVVIDIDDFARCNDTIGRAAGDEVLDAVGERLRSLAPDDLLGRIGSDTFMVFQQGHHGRRLAHSVVDAVRAPIEIVNSTTADSMVAVTVSAGIALGPDHGISLSDLFRSAEHAVGRAKAAGGDRAHASILRSLEASEVTPASQQLAASVRELIGLLSNDPQAKPWVDELVAAYEVARTGGRAKFFALGDMPFETPQPSALLQNARCVNLRQRIQDLTLVLARSATQ